MGGSQSQEFMVYTDAGEDLIASCPVCGYAANLEKATSRLDPVAEMEPTGDGKPELVSHAGLRGHRRCGRVLQNLAGLRHQVRGLHGAQAQPKGRPSARRRTSWHGVAAFLRGDHQVNETKLLFLAAIAASPSGASFRRANCRACSRAELSSILQRSGGLSGPGRARSLRSTPLGRTVLPCIVDKALEGRKNMVCGANKLDYHLRNVTPGRDFTWTLSADIRSVNEGEGCPKKGCTGKLVVGKAVEVGHIFKLGYKYSESMGARVLDENGKEVTPIMGSYGIGIERILTAAIEQSNDANGFWLPASIAPVHGRRHHHERGRRGAARDRRKARRRS